MFRDTATERIVLMKKIATLCLLSLLFAAGVSAAARSPRRDIMGIRINMSKKAAHNVLQKIGQLQREERKRQEIWEVRDDYFTHIIVGFDTEMRVRFVTAVAREEGQRMRYSDVADISKARQAGNVTVNNYHYVWELAAQGKNPKCTVAARGRDPQFLKTYSIKRADEPSDD